MSTSGISTNFPYYTFTALPVPGFAPPVLDPRVSCHRWQELQQAAARVNSPKNISCDGQRSVTETGNWTNERTKLEEQNWTNKTEQTSDVCSVLFFQFCSFSFVHSVLFVQFRSRSVSFLFQFSVSVFSFICSFFSVFQFSF